MKSAWWLGIRLARRRCVVSISTALVALLLAMGAGVIQVVDVTSQLSTDATRLERAGSGRTIFTLKTAGSAQEVEQVAAALSESGLGVAEAAAVYFEVPLVTGGHTFSGRVAARNWRATIFAPTLTVTRGERPGGGGVAVTEAFASTFGAEIGSDLTLDGSSMKVVGIASTPGQGPTSMAVFADIADVVRVSSTASWWIVTTGTTDEATTVMLSERYGLIVNPVSDLVRSGSPIDQRPLLLLGLATVVVGAVVFVMRRAASKSLATSWLALHSVGFRWSAWRMSAAVEAGLVAVAGAFSGWLLSVIAGQLIGRGVAAERGFTFEGIGPASERAALLCVAIVVALVIAAALEPRRSRFAGQRHLLHPTISGVARLGDRLARSHPGRTRSLWWAAVVGAGATVMLWTVVDSVTAADAAAQASAWPLGSVTLVLRGTPPPAGLQQDFESVSRQPSTVVWDVPFAVAESGSASQPGCVPAGIEVDAAAWRTVVGRDWVSEERAALEAGKLIALTPLHVEQTMLRSDSNELLGTLQVYDSRRGDSEQFQCVVSVAALKGMGLTPRPALLVTRTTGGLNSEVSNAMGALVEKYGYPATALRFGVNPAGDTPIVVQVFVILLLVLLAAFYATTFVEAAWDDSPTHRTLAGLGLAGKSRVGLFMRSTVYNAFMGTLVGVFIGALGGVFIGRSMGIPVLALPLGAIAWSFVAVGISAVIGVVTLHLYVERAH